MESGGNSETSLEYPEEKSKYSLLQLTNDDLGEFFRFLHLTKDKIKTGIEFLRLTKTINGI
jgi:hypothetical protein